MAAAGSDLGTVFVSRLLVALEELDGDLVIVLDDVHRLANAADLGRTWISSSSGFPTTSGSS